MRALLAGVLVVLGVALPGFAPRWAGSPPRVDARALANPPSNSPPPWGTGPSVSCDGSTPASCTLADPCWGVTASLSLVPLSVPDQACLQAWARLFDRARAEEGVGPLVLPTNFLSLSAPEQVFVLSNLERTARGLPPMVGLTASLDANAQVAADRSEDPSDAPSIWAEGNATALGAVFGWMYDDGWGGPGWATLNIDCTSPTAPGCWGHRDAILLSGGASLGAAAEARIYAGAGYAPKARLWLSYTEVLAPTRAQLSGAPSTVDIYRQEVGHAPRRLVFSWAQEVRYLPPCERAGDTCPVATPEVVGRRIINRFALPAER